MGELDLELRKLSVAGQLTLAKVAELLGAYYLTADPAGAPPEVMIILRAWREQEVQDALRGERAFREKQQRKSP